MTVIIIWIAGLAGFLIACPAAVSRWIAFAPKWPEPDRLAPGEEKPPEIPSINCLPH
jgi:hypothetical protein